MTLRFRHHWGLDKIKVYLLIEPFSLWVGEEGLEFMKTPKQFALYFDRKAASFDAIYSGQKGLLLQWWNKLTRKNIYYRFEFAIQALNPLTGKKVLDVGCGPGRYSVECAARGSDTVVGVDLSAKTSGFLSNSMGNTRSLSQSMACNTGLPGIFLYQIRDYQVMPKNRL